MREGDPGLDAQPLIREFFGLLCGPCAFRRSNITAGVLAGEPSVSFQTEIENGPLYLVRQLRERVNLRPEPRGVSANLPEVRRMIISGLGIGALPVHAARRGAEAGLLWPLPPLDDLPGIDIHFVTNPRRSLNPAEAAFARMMLRMIETPPLKERTYS